MKVEYRQPDVADAEKIAEVVNQSNREVKHFTDTTADEVRTWTFGDKDFDPKGYLMAFAGGQTVAFAGTTVSKASIEAGNNHAYMSISVVPSWRGKGIEEHIMDSVSRFLRSKGIASLRLWAAREFTWKIDCAVNAGMADVRHSFLMVRTGNVQHVNPGIPDKFSLHHKMMVDTSDSDMKTLMDIVNDTFSESWGFYPGELDDFLKDRNQEKKTGDTESRMTFAKAGNQVVGVCMGSVRKDYNRQHDAKAGWAYMLGVTKAHRRSGLGRALLADSMAWLLERGMDTLYLGVDAENDRALKLYTSLGFSVEQETIVFELKL